MRSCSPSPQVREEHEVPTYVSCGVVAVGRATVVSCLIPVWKIEKARHRLTSRSEKNKTRQKLAALTSAAKERLLLYGMAGMLRVLEAGGCLPPFFKRTSKKAKEP